MDFKDDLAHILSLQSASAELIRRNLHEAVELNGSTDYPAIATADAEAQASLFSIDDITKGPAYVAWKLVEKASLNSDQIGPVALVVDKMQQQWEKLIAQAPELACADAHLWSSHTFDDAILPLFGVLIRLLLVGGGGCGKSRLINKVFTPLLMTYYGRRGLMKEAPSNKAARNIGGETFHNANKLNPTSSLLTPHLRQKPRQQAAMRRFAQLGAKLFDEFSQALAKLWHADARKVGHRLV